MFKPLIFYIGLRYTRAKRRTQFISFITFTSVAGIAVGVTVLITVLSVMNGFDAELRERILGMTAHSTITGRYGQLDNWLGLANRTEHLPHVLGVAPFVHGQVMINADRQVSGTLLQGVLPDYEAKVSEVATKMLSGSLNDLKPGEFGIVLGVELANYLGVIVGDKVTIITTLPAESPPRWNPFGAAGSSYRCDI